MGRQKKRTAKKYNRSQRKNNTRRKTYKKRVRKTHKKRVRRTHKRMKGGSNVGLISGETKSQPISEKIFTIGQGVKDKTGSFAQSVKDIGSKPVSPLGYDIAPDAPPQAAPAPAQQVPATEKAFQFGEWDFSELLSPKAQQGAAQQGVSAAPTQAAPAEVAPAGEAPAAPAAPTQAALAQEEGGAEGAGEDETPTQAAPTQPAPPALAPAAPAAPAAPTQAAQSAQEEGGVEGAGEDEEKRIDPSDSVLRTKQEFIDKHNNDSLWNFVGTLQSQQNQINQLLKEAKNTDLNDNPELKEQINTLEKKNKLLMGTTGLSTALGAVGTFGFLPTAAAAGAVAGVAGTAAAAIKSKNVALSGAEKYKRYNSMKSCKKCIPDMVAYHVIDGDDGKELLKRYDENRPKVKITHSSSNLEEQKNNIQKAKIKENNNTPLQVRNQVA